MPLDPKSVRVLICVGFLTILSVLYSLSLVGCVSNSPGVPGIFLVKLENVHTNATVQVGYFGLCSSSPKEPWLCQPTFGTNWNDTLDAFPSTDPNMKQILNLGHDIQRKIIVFVPLLVGAILFLASFCALLCWALGGTMENARKASMLLTSYSVAGAVGAASAVTMASSALRFAGATLAPSNESAVVATGGMALQALQWLIVVFTLLWHLTAGIMLRSGKE